MDSVCRSCKERVEQWNEECGSCGFKLVLEPEERIRARYLRGPSLGALLWTQGWAFGSRLYLWFLLSLVPVVGLALIFVLLIFGRRLSWKQGGWGSWDEFVMRMRVLDALGALWLVVLIVSYFIARNGVT